MIESTIHFIQQFLLPYGAFGVFVASIIEEVAAPIPSALVLTSAGFFLIPNHAWSLHSLEVLLFTIAIPGALGVTIGSLLVYGIGYWSGKPVLERWGKILGISWADVGRVEEKFKNSHSDEVALFTVRAIPIIPSVVISTFCGLIRLPLREYLIFSFLGTIIRAFILAAIGWQVGAIYESIAQSISKAENFIIIGIAVFVIAYIGYRLYRRWARKRHLL